MRLVLLLRMATCLTGCVPQFPFSCEDEQASICSLQRRPIFAPRDKPPSARTSECREGAWPDAAPQSPEGAGPRRQRHRGCLAGTSCARRMTAAAPARTHAHAVAVCLGHGVEALWVDGWRGVRADHVPCFCCLPRPRPGVGAHASRAIGQKGGLACQKIDLPSGMWRSWV